MSNIRHLVFTNFGVGIKDIEWIAYRMELLMNITANSILSQTFKNFTWNIFIDFNLPYIYKARLFELSSKAGQPFVEIHQVEDYSEIQNSIANIIKRHDLDEPILTTRIDDDDALNINAFEIIQKSAVESLNSNIKVSLISLNNGLEWLPSEKVFRFVSYESIALGLTLLSNQSEKIYSITQLAHHKAVETLKSKISFATYNPIDINGVGYLYTKHQLSDSYYVGSKARILQDVNSFGVNEIDVSIFGLSLKDVDHVKKVFMEAPLGMPHKYLAKLGELRNDLKRNKSSSFPKSQDNDEVEDFSKEILAKIEWYQKNAVRKNPYSRGSKPRVAIIGSCVTRDLFSHRPELMEKYEVVAYLARQSVISYTSSPCGDVSVRNRISDSGFESRRAQWDMDKSHWKVLEAARPDVIIIDFIDERIGVIFHQGSIITPSGPIIKAFEKAGIEHEIIRPWDNKLIKIREWAVREFLMRCYSICNNIIVHKAGWAHEYIENESINSFFDTKYKTLVNLNTSVLNQVFENCNLADIPFEVIGGGELMRAGGKYLWSFSPYHYDYSYYKQLSKDLIRRL